MGCVFLRLELMCALAAHLDYEYSEGALKLTPNTWANGHTVQLPHYEAHGSERGAINTLRLTVGRMSEQLLVLLMAVCGATHFTWACALIAGCCGSTCAHRIASYSRNTPRKRRRRQLN